MGIGHYWRILVVSRENLHDFSLKVQYYSCEQIMTIPQEFFMNVYKAQLAHSNC